MTEAFNPRNILNGDLGDITSSRIQELPDGFWQIEFGMGQNGIAVRLNDANVAEFIGDTFQHLARRMRGEQTP